MRISSLKHQAIEKVSKDIIHQCMEDSGGIGETERHDQLFKMVKVSDEMQSSIHLPPDGQMVGISEV